MPKPAALRRSLGLTAEANGTAAEANGTAAEAVAGGQNR